MDADSFHLVGFDPEVTFDEAVAAVTDEWPCDWWIYWALESGHAPSYLTLDQWEEAVNLNVHAQRPVGAATRLSRRKLREDRRTLPTWLATESQMQRRQFDEVARSLREQLTPEQLDDRNWQVILDSIEGETRAEERERFFGTAVEILAFTQFGYGPRALANRVLKILSYLVSTKSERVQAYLHRVARCYVLDLRPELGIMARAVMEAALQDFGMESPADRIRQARGKPYPTLSDWIEAASSAGLFEEEARLAAGRVRSAGDDAVH